jgi:hypothetical protein
MSKKLFIGVVPLLVAAAFAVAPVAAQAAGPHWTCNKSECAKGKRIPTVTWGTLELKSALGIVKCHNVDAGWIENPTSGNPGIDATENFIPYFFPCEAPGCPGEIKVIGEGLSTTVAGTTFLAPESWWPSELEVVEGVIRDKAGLTATSPTKNVKVRIQCNIGTEDVVNTVYEGENFPQQVNGTSAAKPAFGEFGAGSGGLVSKEFGGSETIGKDKIMGYEEQEVLGAA